ncbi:MFS transporter [Pelagibacterium halotolerans]|uniref:MFS transporter n=1 Tax=Pelagibacterium halotolerans TaxID=531813 RepID=UPI003850D283
MSATRNIVLLSGNQAIAGSSQGIVIAVGALAAATLSPDRALATVPTTIMIIGMALTAGPAAIILHRLGRTRGLMLGVTIGMAGGLLAALGLALGSFIVLSLAYGLIGAAGAFGQQTRFAAADSVPPDMKARAVSWVLFGGVLAGFLGPRLASMTAETVPGAPYAGSFISLAALGIVALAFLSFTRLPKGEPKPQPGASGRSTTQLLRDPDIFVPMITAMASYALMTFVMVAAPLAMVYICGHSTADAANSIQWHVVAMFAPSFVTGAIISRIGTHMTIGIGLVLILAAAATSLNGITTLHFDIALVLLGLGWNFGFIGSTVLLSKGYRPEEGARAQALNEQFVFGTMAVASIGAGVLLNVLGWEAINLMVMPIVAAAILLLAWADLRSRRPRGPAMPSD